MKIAFFVHDCHLEIGHTRAQIELLRNIPNNIIEEIIIISFSFSEKNKLFPEFPQKIKFIKIPSILKYPLLIKSIYFQLISFFISKLLLNNHIKIGIGICCLHVDYINIQFLHWPWSKIYFSNSNLKGFSLLYKKILFYYFDMCEKYIFKSKHIKYFCLSQFITDEITHRFPNTKDRIKTIYSGFNFEEFKLTAYHRQELYLTLKQKYPQLNKISPEKPIILFIGAHQRKGLPEIIRQLPAESQLVAIGKSEKGQSINIDGHTNISFIDHTKEVKLFYQLADAFIFPTLYEPFGLVLTEAASMGTIIITNKKMVGASEILNQLQEIYFIDQIGHIPFNNVRLLNYEEKKSIADHRIQHLSNFSWENQSKLLLDFISKSDHTNPQ